MRILLSSLLLAVLLAGCKTPTALTAQAIGCSRTGVDIVDSEFKRQGSTTAWCARCEGKVYQCVTTPARDRVECREARPGSPCG
ncbi:MAG TPA: hypothetical protein VNM24_12735 [Burkholderiales bacterium]|jgi:hypothetical protein|nr:hypothetical protein [Burkholderiales bacterium]